ncbi:hypothetical protein Micbo1qcDRAFT_179109 [Microdochium bolleyi]|uniref:Clr5 domain-containing protein n=1 Tax=Microdochium bolleyi TaxID=196109 RepID=A0A136IQL9_9PEZI|nr:hypothetical protein Micbo1qcDRAFT_179109 [Microdochium bolleyi]
MSELLQDSHNKEAITQLFHDHKELIRQLYQGHDGKSKTLKQIKQIMESIHGFPDIPLPQYEVKLKKGLGLRKKLSRHDWAAVWDHYRTIKDKSGEPVAIFLNGTEIPWAKAWKEIRRNCDHRAVAPSRLRPLPQGVTIAARLTAKPSSLPRNGGPATSEVIASASPRINHIPPVAVADSRSACTIHTGPRSVDEVEMGLNNGHKPAKAADFRPVLAVQTSRCAAPAFEQSLLFSSTINDILSPERFITSWKAGNVRNLPWIQFMSTLFSMSGLAKAQAYGIWRDCEEVEPARVAFQQLCLSLDTLSLVEKVFDPALFRTSDEGVRPSTALGLQFDAVYFLGKAVLRLCNTEILLCEEHRMLYKIIFGRIMDTSRHLLLVFFGSTLPSVLVTCYQLLHLAVILQDKNSFVVMMNAHFGRFQAAPDCSKTTIMGAAQFGCLDILENVLAHAQADELDLESIMWGINAATVNGHSQCAEKITDAFFNDDVDDDGNGVGRSLFQQFFHTVGSDYTSKESVMLSCFSKNGIKMRDLYNGTFLEVPTAYDEIYGLHEVVKIPLSWRHSYLEWAYGLASPIYAVMEPYRRSIPERLVRDRICQTAKRGLLELAQYVQSVSGDHAKFLQLVLAEQFMVATPPAGDTDAVPVDIDWTVVAALMEVGVNPDLKLLECAEVNATLLMCRAFMSFATHGMSDIARTCIKHLLKHGATFDTYVIAAAVSTTGFGALPLIIDFGGDVKGLGGRALALAAKFNNYNAVNWLLDVGVDATATIAHERPGQSRYPRILTVLGTSLVQKDVPHCLNHSSKLKRRRWKFYVHYQRPNPSMIRYLASKGAPLRFRPDDEDWETLFQRYHDLVAYSEDSTVMAETLALFLEHGILFSHTKVCDVLETVAEAEDWGSFELLLDRVAPLSEAAPLALLILEGAPRSLVRKTLGAVLTLEGYSWRSGYSPASAAASRWDLTLLKELVTRSDISFAMRTPFTFGPNRHSQMHSGWPFRTVAWNSSWSFCIAASTATVLVPQMKHIGAAERTLWT